MNRSPGRIVAVTVGLMAGGALFGAIAAVVALFLATMITHDLALGTEPIALMAAAMFGAMVGAPLFPAVGWLLLRRVPLGIALIGSMAGTVLGGIAGWVASGGNAPLSWPIGGAIIGFLCAAVAMRLRFASPRPAAIRVPSGG